MLKNLNNNENGFTKENELLISLNTDLIKYAVNNNEKNLFKIVNWLNKSNEVNNNYGFTVTSIILNLNNENDFKTFKNLCLSSISDLSYFKLKSNNIDLNNAFVYVFENNNEYIVINKNNMVQFIIDFIMYNYYNNFLYDLFMFLSSLI